MQTEIKINDKPINQNPFYRIPNTNIKCNHLNKGNDKLNRVVCLDCGMVLSYIN